MSDVTSNAMSGSRTVTAFFDTSDHATAARADLIAAGIPESDINMVGSNADHFTIPEDRHAGFWESLANFFMPDDDRRAYAEGLRRGGFAISVRASGMLYDKAIDVLDRDGAVDFDEREMTWAKEGWSRSDAGVDNLEGTTTYRPADAGTAGFGGSYAGEDGLAPPAGASPMPLGGVGGVEGSGFRTGATPTGPSGASQSPAMPMGGVGGVEGAGFTGTGTTPRPSGASQSPAMPMGGVGGVEGQAERDAPLIMPANPDVRERIGAGTASQTAPVPTGGPQTYGGSATPADDRAADIVEGRPGDGYDVFGRRDVSHGRSRVRSYIVDDATNRRDM